MTAAAEDPVSAELAAWLGGCTVRRLWAEQDEGPYHREASPVRRDIVEDRHGVALQLGVRLVIDEAALPAAAVEVWQCDALGRYSGFPLPDSPATVTAGFTPRPAYLPGETFLRGRQVTDVDGMVEFTTIYPGWYPGRTVHIHLIVHTPRAMLTSQLYFPDDISDAVLALSPYRDRPTRDTTNASDPILPTGGEPAILDVRPAPSGYRAAICLVVPADPNGEDE